MLSCVLNTTGMQLLGELSCMLITNHHHALPFDLSASLCTHQTSRTLRVSKEKLLEVPKRNQKSVGDRSFSFMCPNYLEFVASAASLRKLPTLSDFEAQLKTCLKQAFPQI